MALGPTRREQIIGNAMAALSANLGDKPAGLKVERGRRHPTQKDDCPILLVYAIEEEKKPSDNRRSGIADRLFKLRVKARWVGAESAGDPLLNWIVRQMMVNPSRGGLALETDELATDWEAEDASDAVFNEAAVLYQVRYTTGRGNLEAAA